MAISGVTDYANTYAGYTNSANGKKHKIHKSLIVLFVLYFLALQIKPLMVLQFSLIYMQQ